MTRAAGKSSREPEAETYAALEATDTINTAFGKIKKFFADIATNIRSTVLTGLSVETGTAVEATDSILAGVGKLQAQATNLADESTMPHIFENAQDGKTYKYGYQVSEDGIPQIIYEEVV